MGNKGRNQVALSKLWLLMIPKDPWAGGENQHTCFLLPFLS